MSHTPGPWFVGHDDAHDCPPHRDSGLALVDTGRTEDYPIARLCEWNNAKLIAAAPDLLAACQLALGAFERNDAMDWDVLQRAIAKATAA